MDNDINLTDILSLDSLEEDFADDEFDSNPTDVRKSLADFFSHAKVLSTAIEANRNERNQILDIPPTMQDNSTQDNMNFDQLVVDIDTLTQLLNNSNSDDIDDEILQHKVSKLLKKLKKIEKGINYVQNQNRTLSQLIASCGNVDNLKMQLVAENNELQRKNKMLNSTMVHQKQIQDEKLNQALYELHQYEDVRDDKIGIDVKLPVVRDENIRLKQEKMRLVQLLEIGGNKRKESENLCQKLELEAMERDIQVFQNKANKSERYKLRPLRREVTMLKQKNKDLSWSLNDKQLISDKNQDYIQKCAAIEHEKLKNIDKINLCYKDKISAHERQIDDKKDRIEALNMENHNICEWKQGLMQSQYKFTNSVRMKNETEVRNIQLDLKNLNTKYENLQLQDKQWKQCVAENVEYIHKLTANNDGGEIQRMLSKLKEIDGSLKAVGYYTIGVNNMIYNVDSSIHCRDETESESTCTNDVMNMIDSKNSTPVRLLSTKSGRSNREPPRPPQLALHESTEPISTKSIKRRQKTRFKAHLSSKISAKMSMYQNL